MAKHPRCPFLTLVVITSIYVWNVGKEMDCPYLFYLKKGFSIPGPVRFVQAQSRKMIDIKLKFEFFSLFWSMIIILYLNPEWLEYVNNTKCMLHSGECIAAIIDHPGCTAPQDVGVMVSDVKPEISPTYL